MNELKNFIEQRNAKIAEMETLLGKVKEETRAFSDDEQKQYETLKNEIRSLDKTVEALEEARNFEKKEPAKQQEGEKQEDAEIRAFADYIRHGKNALEQRAATPQNFTTGDNGAIIPQTIAKTIIKKVHDICPIFAMADVYHVKGKLRIPVYGARADSKSNDHDITVGYATEFTELTADAGAFTSVELDGYLIGALTLVGKTLINSSDIDLVNFVTSYMAEKIALFIEKELLVGTGSSACSGAITTTNTLNAGSTTAITADNLITLKNKVKQAFQAKACWIMHPDTYTAVLKLKDSQNRYLLQNDITNDFGNNLLGKPVYLSDNMPTIASAAKAVLFGDFSGLKVNLHEDIEINVLLEHYSNQHAIGVNAWLEMDSKVAENQKIAALVMTA